jgi:hypothetical protein
MEHRLDPARPRWRRASGAVIVVAVAFLVVACASTPTTTSGGGESPNSFASATPALTGTAPATSSPSAAAAAATSPTLGLPTPPGNLVALLRDSESDLSACRAANANADFCLLLSWSPSQGQVLGYRIYAGPIMGVCAEGLPCDRPSDWCKDGNTAGVKPAATAAAGTTSYLLPMEGDHSPSCVAVSAYNAVGESSRTVVGISGAQP